MSIQAQVLINNEKDQYELKVYCSGNMIYINSATDQKNSYEIVKNIELLEQVCSALKINSIVTYTTIYGEKQT